MGVSLAVRLLDVEALGVEELGVKTVCTVLVTSSERSSAFSKATFLKVRLAVFLKAIAPAAMAISINPVPGSKIRSKIR